MANAENKEIATVTISLSDYTELVYFKHKLIFLEQIQALQSTIRDLEAENLKLISEKYADITFDEALKGVEVEQDG